jgi:hypothetical protein
MGRVSKEIGGHEIIIRGQIPDYIVKMNFSYDLPPNTPKNNVIKAGYSFPSVETANVEKALKNSNKSVYNKIDIGDGSTTFIF